MFTYNVYIFLKHSFHFMIFFPFPKVKVRIKSKSPHSPWITKRIAKSSKRKQKLYEKYQKRRATETETAYKSYKNLFESIKRRSKQS